MRTPIRTVFILTWHKLLSATQSRVRRLNNDQENAHSSHPFNIPHFDADSEGLFWEERQCEALTTLKTALLLGAGAFLAFLLLDLWAVGLPLLETISRVAIIGILCALWLHLQQHPRPHRQITRVAKLSTGLSIIGLASILLLEAKPAFYTDTWVGLLPIFFFTYGQMFMTTTATLGFGVLATIALPLCGYLIGVDPIALLPSILILLIVNAFGFCTRCQLESHSRNLFQERRKAECEAENKTLFLRQISHNLRQPLQALSCYSAVLDAQFCQKADDPLQPIVHKLGSAIDELNNAFNHVLDIANLESGKQIPLLVAVDINVLLARLEDQFAPLAAKHHLKLIMRLRSRPPFSVYSDPSMLSQIIGNLLDNAIKYTKHGWIMVEAVKIGGNRLKLHIRDTGIGIAETQKQQIFQDKQRVHRRCDDPQVQGLGIGLAYILTALDHLPNHSLTVYSKPQQGSDFQLSLPAAIQAPYYPEAPYSIDMGVAGRFVFIVDDDLEVLDALTEQLCSWGCLVQKACSKAETLAALADTLRPPDLLITDYYLANQESAHDIMACIEADCGKVPTIILSAHAIAAAEKAKWSDNILLLRKPANAAVLLETMAKALKSKA